MPADPPASLADLRKEIDRIDEAMHRLLMERGEIIDRLIATKGTARSGAAFRPDREASMMRALAERHAGLLPLDTAEGIWRVIIATFTFVQAPFAVHADASGGDAPVRDSARFHFGFTVPYRPQPDAPAAIAAVAASRGDLGLVRLDQGASAGAWWRGLEAPDGPRIIARLPFIERPDHPAGTPVLVVSRPLENPGAGDVALHSATFDRWPAAAAARLPEIGGAVLGSAGLPGGLSVLLALPGAIAGGDSRAALGRIGLQPSRLTAVGSHAERFQLPDRAG